MFENLLKNKITFLVLLIFLTSFHQTIFVSSRNTVDNNIQIGSIYSFYVGGANVSQEWSVLGNVTPYTGLVFLNVTKMNDTGYFGYFQTFKYSYSTISDKGQLLNLTNIWIWKGFHSESDWINYTLTTNNSVINNFTITDQYFSQNHVLVENRQKNSTIETLKVNTTSDVLLFYQLYDPNHLIENIKQMQNLTIGLLGTGIKYFDYRTLTSSQNNNSKSTESFFYYDLFIPITIITLIRKNKFRKLIK